MANDITAVIPKLLAQGLMALRENAVMPRICANRTSQIAGSKGSSLEVPLPSAIAATDVTPAATAPAGQDSAPTVASVTLNNWKEAAFYMTDQEWTQSMDGVIPMQASEAIRSIVNAVDVDLFSNYKKIYGSAGSPGTTPFGSTTAEGRATRKVLNQQLAPMDSRHLILDPDAEDNALGLDQFTNVNFTGSVQAMLEGKLEKRLGFNMWMNQNVPTHTSTPLTAGNLTVNGTQAAGLSTISLAKATNASPLVAGDILTIAGRSYAVAADVTLAAGNTNVTLSTPLRASITGGAAVTLTETHVVNLGMHRDCIAFANRPMAPAPNGLGSVSMAQVDPVSGLALRLEVTREYKRTRWSYDFLWGSQCIRPELGARLMG